MNNISGENQIKSDSTDKHKNLIFGVKEYR